VIRAEIVGFDHGRVTPVRTRETKLPAARWLGESGRIVKPSSGVANRAAASGVAIGIARQ